MPSHRNVLCGEGFFQSALCFQQRDQRRRLLVTDSQRFLCFGGKGDAQGQPREQTCQQRTAIAGLCVFYRFGHGTLGI